MIYKNKNNYNNNSNNKHNNESDRSLNAGYNTKNN